MTNTNKIDNIKKMKKVLVIGGCIFFLSILILNLFFKIVISNYDIDHTRVHFSRAKMATVVTAINKFYFDCDRYPDDSNGLNELIICPSGLESNWKGPYLKRSDLLDSWGNPYVYIKNGKINQGSFDLISYGADGLPGGEGVNKDIYNDRNNRIGKSFSLYSR